tara:strand:+ start:299 stop:583 length:285 start_codon:yes stop_codon:yes gene_type:complete
MERLYWAGTPHEIILHDPMNPEYHIGSIYQDSENKVGFIFCQDPFLVFVVGQNNLNQVACVDQSLREWTGQYLIHFLKTAELHLRDYSRIGQRF